mmetsp:Transcript_38506/g.90911  ORF Transcript_38506/g.90911 Transcript_38506/m.90911 type:complete len:295 (-) Transcript_38506:980-1864(-)
MVVRYPATPPSNEKNPPPPKIVSAFGSHGSPYTASKSSVITPDRRSGAESSRPLQAMQRLRKADCRITSSQWTRLWTILIRFMNSQPFSHGLSRGTLKISRLAFIRKRFERISNASSGRRAKKTFSASGLAAWCVLGRMHSMCVVCIDRKRDSPGSSSSNCWIRMACAVSLEYSLNIKSTMYKRRISSSIASSLSGAENELRQYCSMWNVSRFSSFFVRFSGLIVLARMLCIHSPLALARVNSDLGSIVFRFVSAFEDHRVLSICCCADGVRTELPPSSSLRSLVADDAVVFRI